MEDKKEIVEVNEVKIERHKWPDEKKDAKKSKLNRRISIAVLSFFMFLLGMGFSQAIAPYNTNQESNKFSEIEKILTEKWYFGKDVENLDTFIPDNGFYGMANLSAIDPHTSYLSAAEIASYTEGLSGSYVGIGIQYYESDNGILIVDRVFEDSPAEIGGMMAGDIIFKVEDKLAADLDINQVSELVRGEADTPVTLTVLRDNKEVIIKMIRKQVIHSSFGEQLTPEVALIELEQFGETTAGEVENYLKRFKDSKHLIIDLRNNGGGYLNSVIEITSLFVGPDKTVLITENKNGDQYVENTLNKEAYTFDDITILVNGGTASASEVLTAALKYHLDNVSVVGVKTYGKGTVQQTQFLSDNSALKYTTAEWFGPDSGKIHGVGITPDFEVKLAPIIESGFMAFPEGNTYQKDQVGEVVKYVQEALDFLGYSMDRKDGYFDEATHQAVVQFQKSMNIEANGQVNEDNYNLLISKTVREYNQNKAKYDTQKNYVLNQLGVK